MSKTILSERHFITLSDIHLGHANTSTEHIVKSLEAFLGLYDDELKFPKLKLVFITGDLWDKSVQLGADFIPEFLYFWYRFCRWAVRHKLKVRLLKGTPRHDGNQGASVEHITRNAFPTLDFKYFSELCIDHEDAFDLNILYVPDECRSSADILYKDVKELLAEKHLSQVDLAMMHGMFKFQLGSIPLNHKVHNEQDYLDLVKGVIAIGHIHKPSQYERIYVPGSFDRLAHGEEEPKGAYFFKEHSPGHWLPVFLENSLAKVYRSIELVDDLELCYQSIDEVYRSVPSWSNLRLIAPPQHPLLSNIDGLIKRYPEAKITLKVLQGKKEKENVEIRAEHHALVLNKSTLNQLILSEIQNVTLLEPEDQEKLGAILNKLHK